MTATVLIRPNDGIAVAFEVPVHTSGPHEGSLREGTLAFLTRATIAMQVGHAPEWVGTDIWTTNEHGRPVVAMRDDRGHVVAVVEVAMGAGA